MAMSCAIEILVLGNRYISSRVHSRRLPVATGEHPSLISGLPNCIRTLHQGREQRRIERDPERLPKRTLITYTEDISVSKRAHTTLQAELEPQVAP